MALVEEIQSPGKMDQNKIPCVSQDVLGVDVVAVALALVNNHLSRARQLPTPADDETVSRFQSKQPVPATSA